MTWDEWRGDLDNRVVMRIKHLAAWRGWKLDLHQFVDVDAPGCRHTHPAKAIRVVLWSGYIEEVEVAPGVLELRVIRPGHIGIVRPELCHRVAALRGRMSYSLWFRWPKTHQVELRGEGWPS